MNIQKTQCYKSPVEKREYEKKKKYTSRPIRYT